MDFFQVLASAQTVIRLSGFHRPSLHGQTGMFYSIDLIAASSLLIEHIIPAISVFIALALAIVFIE